MFFLLSRAWEKENFWVLKRKRTSDLRIPRSDTLPMSQRDSTVSEVYHKVHMTRVLHTARISNVDGVMFVIGIRDMVSFELGKETEKDVFLLVTSVGKRNTSESPWGIEPQTFGFHAHLSLWGSVLEHPSADLSLFLHRTQNLQSL